MADGSVHYLALLKPISNLSRSFSRISDVEQAIWESPAGSGIRAQLIKAGVERGISLQHAHLSSPLHGKPLLDTKKITPDRGSLRSRCAGPNN